jgi:hypothetical protein
VGELVNPAEIMDAVISKGDIGKLTPAERSTYYAQVCRSIGLNPLTRPFEYLTLNGKMVLYARRDAADQLRKINGISVEIVSREVLDGLLTVHVRATDKSGRIDEDFGVVNVGTLKGEAAANAFLKAVTKAKRRVTLSISGLGFLDEAEVEDIPATAKRTPPVQLITKPAQPADDMRGDGEVLVDGQPDIDHEPDGEVISVEQADTIRELLEATGAPRAKFLKWAKVEKIEDLTPDVYDSCIEAIKGFKKASAS